mmetsp:Transcript_12019/g.50324  ORF Transcript_12019/g.50324 Transcript_12019/m.50324 type:complete len:266 (+) Transcript_12019:984-1781(+)
MEAASSSRTAISSAGLSLVCVATAELATSGSGTKVDRTDCCDPRPVLAPGAPLALAAAATRARRDARFSPMPRPGNGAQRARRPRGRRVRPLGGDASRSQGEGRARGRGARRGEDPDSGVHGRPLRGVQQVPAPRAQHAGQDGAFERGPARRWVYRVPRARQRVRPAHGHAGGGVVSRPTDAAAGGQAPGGNPRASPDVRRARGGWGHDRGRRRQPEARERFGALNRSGRGDGRRGGGVFHVQLRAGQQRRGHRRAPRLRARGSS